MGARALVGSPYLGDPKLRRAYDDEIAPRTQAALAKIFAEVPIRVTRALDLGAGTGAVGAAIRTRFGKTVELVSVDQVAGPGIVVADLRRGARPAGVSGRFDLVVAAHLLNELAVSVDIEARTQLVVGWCEELLTIGGTCVLVEPALRETSRGLLAVRDGVVARGLHVVAPCFWRGPCPALARERDWCHDTALPSTEAARRGGQRVDFSYLVLRHAPVTEAVAANVWRVVSDPLKDKGRLRFFGCGTAGRVPLMRLTRDRSDRNRAFEDVRRGDVIEIAASAGAGDDLRVTADTAVSVRRHPS